MKEKRIHDKTHEILKHIDTYGTVDKDVFQGEPERGKKRIVRKRTPRMVVDLHGMKTVDAVLRIKLAFSRVREQGIKEILIIHGKGYHSDPGEGPVLKKLVREMLDGELRNQIRDYRTALARDGGDGATLVIVK